MARDVALGIMAYNEEANIGPLLDSVLAQTATDRIAQIVVVASGCTDGTAGIVRGRAARDPRIRLIEEVARDGKVRAINNFLLEAQAEIILISSADLVMPPGTIDALIAPFSDPEIGMTGAHSVPVNSPGSFFGFAATMMWELHHQISLREPKMGELIAFRNVFRRLNPAAICDELSVHQLIRSAGYRVAYVPDAIVNNKGPETLRDFVSQRMHCIVGNLEVMHEHNVSVSTMRPALLLKVAAPFAATHIRRLHWIAGVAAIEAYCRLRASLVPRSTSVRGQYRVWEPARTTKQLTAP